MDNRVAAGGLLVAALSAPHVLGPVVARFLDKAREKRWMLAGSFAIYAGALTGSVISAGRLPLVITVALAVIAGACGPMLTGGLSSELAGIAAGSKVSRRRAEALDSLTYGVGSSAGPAAVAALAVLFGAATALFAVAAAAATAAALTLTLPFQRRPADIADSTLSIRHALVLLWQLTPLRRVLLATCATAVSIGALPVVTAAMTVELHQPVASGGVMVAAFGVGSLAGSLLVTFRPHHGDPERLVTRYIAGMAAAFTVAALAPTYPLAIAAFAVAGFTNGPFVAATLAARSDYAPDSARAQLFITFAGLKIAAASAGASTAGVALAVAGGRMVMLFSAIIVFAAALIAATHRIRHTRRS